MTTMVSNDSRTETPAPEAVAEVAKNSRIILPDAPARLRHREPSSRVSFVLPEDNQGITNILPKEASIAVASGSYCYAADQIPGNSR